MERSCQVNNRSGETGLVVCIFIIIIALICFALYERIASLESRITDLELADEVDTELHAKNIETDDLQTMAIGAIIRQMTSEKEDWQ